MCSRYCGKFDLADHIAGQGGWFDKDGNPVKFGQEGVSVYYSDELRDFEAFKKKTGGVIHQHYLIKKIDENNRDFVKDHCKFFNYLYEDYDTIDEKSKNCKIVHKHNPIYAYYGKEYTLKELNKKGVYVEIDIHFNTLLDLIPYYPYIVSCASCNEDKEYVVISKESYVDEKFEEHLQHGWMSEVDYKGQLQKHYLEVCKKYFLYKLEERTKIIDIDITDGEIYDKDNNIVAYRMRVNNEIDYMHDIEFVWSDGEKHTHWTSPKLLNSADPFEDDKYNLIELSKEDVEDYLAEDIKNGTVKIKYVEKCEFPLGVK